MRSGLRTSGIVLGAAVLVLSGMGISWARDNGGNADKIVQRQSSPGARVVAVSPPDQLETTFVPITPCRIVNTRAKGGPVSAPRSFYVGGTQNFVSQGGTSGGCGIPASASAVAANVVATGGTKSGFVKAYPAGGSAPNASIVNYSTGTIANGVSLAIRAGTAPALTVSASSPVQILIDITGFYAPQIEAFVNSDGGVATGTARVLGVTHTANSGVYSVSLDTAVFSCSANATTGGGGFYASAITGSRDVTVRTWKLDTSGQPVYEEHSFNLTVTC